MSSVTPPGAQVDLDPSVFPRTYTTSTGNRVFLFLISCIAVTAGLLGTWYFATGHETKGPREPYIFGLVSLFFFLLGAYLAIATIKSKIVLTTDSIELHELFTTKQLFRSQLAGWKIIPTQYVSTLILVPSDPNARKMRIGLTVKVDDCFFNWLSAAPNLDEIERQQSRMQLESNLELGLTHEQRSERIAAGMAVAARLNWVVLGVLQPGVGSIRDRIGSSF